MLNVEWMTRANYDFPKKRPGRLSKKATTIMTFQNYDLANYDIPKKRRTFLEKKVNDMKPLKPEKLPGALSESPVVMRMTFNICN